MWQQDHCSLNASTHVARLSGSSNVMNAHTVSNPSLSFFSMRAPLLHALLVSLDALELHAERARLFLDLKRRRLNLQVLQVIQLRGAGDARAHHLAQVPDDDAVRQSAELREVFHERVLIRVLGDAPNHHGVVRQRHDGVIVLLDVRVLASLEVRD